MQQAKIVAAASRFIADSETEPDLATLAARAGLSASHFHRLFKRATGLTPKGYASAHRESRVRGALKNGASATEAIFEAGYNATSRLYEKSNALLGMTPTAYRAGGTDISIRFAVGKCSLGSVLVAQSALGVCAIFIGDNSKVLVCELRDYFPHAELNAAHKDFKKVIARVIDFVDTPKIGLDLPLDIRGTAFQKRVWRALSKIPTGKTVTYSEVAKRIGAPKSVRSVASACAANTLAVAIPCHRVLRSDGSLSGYRWGVARKRALLKKESSR